MSRPKPPAKRCAIYTRKSSEEGLEQDFNSLHAQREACEAYVSSQRSEGWIASPTMYDDGGFSGGSMERPALKRLLEDIRARRIDTVVVYKIDRLTRSLTDFAKMVEVFDAAGVSFVAVTQQFNTTTSMGRLTLNILLSFAQFEREVTAERIRDKIAASKKKGMWMGGLVPLGYDAEERELRINPVEAETARHIFRRYLDLGSVRLLREELENSGIRSKARRRADGRPTGNMPFSRGALYTLLSNPVYVGEIRHGELRWPGRHEAIVDRELWDRVQARLADASVEREDRPQAETSPLAGKLFETDGERLTPSHAVKNGRRYRYYVSAFLTTGTKDPNRRGRRIPAPDLERAVARIARGMLEDRTALGETLTENDVPIGVIPGCLARAEELGRRFEATDLSETHDAIKRVEVSDDGVIVTLSLSAVTGDTDDALTMTRFAPMSVRRRGIEMRLVLPSADTSPRSDPTLIKAVARARSWWKRLTSGEVSTLSAIAENEGVTLGHVRRLLPLAFLAPSIVETIVEGLQPPDLTVEALIKRVELPPDWNEQRELLLGR